MTALSSSLLVPLVLSSRSSTEEIVAYAGKSIQLVIPSHPLAKNSFKIKPYSS